MVGVVELDLGVERRPRVEQQGDVQRPSFIDGQADQVLDLFEAVFSEGAQLGLRMNDVHETGPRPGGTARANPTSRASWSTGGSPMPPPSHASAAVKWATPSLWKET